MWERIREIFIKELRQTLREPRMRVMLFAPPLIQLIVFGFAVNLDVEHVRLVWMDGDSTPDSRELLAAFEGSGRFTTVAATRDERVAQDYLDSGEGQAIVRVMPGFAADLKRNRPAQVQVIIDGTNSNTASLVASYSTSILSRFSSLHMDRQRNVRMLMRSAANPVNIALPGVNAQSRVWFNPDLRSRYYFVPGVLVNIIMIVTIMLTALGIVREKEIGTMEQLMVTPVRPIELMLGKTLPFALIGVGQVVLITSAALLIFGVPFRGNVLLLLASAVLFLMTTLGVGLFLSTISHTQQQAMMGMFFFVTPAFMLSGFAFPIQNMPVAVQYLTYLNPARYCMEIVRGLFLKGTGFTVLWPQMLSLFVFGIAIVSFSALRFQKKLD
jgi:drug efflux transport system permease protein